MRVSWKLPVVTRILNKKNNNQYYWYKFFMQNPNIRHLTIPKTLVKTNIHIYNGHLFDDIVIVRKMIGFKIGNFSITKVLGKEFHLSREKKKKKKR